jgi:chromosome segregation ATPase
MKMSELSELAAKYARQKDMVDDLWRSSQKAQANYKSAQDELDETQARLQAAVSSDKPNVIIPIGFKRHVLVHKTNGAFGSYASIDIIEETQI